MGTADGGRNRPSERPDPLHPSGPPSPPHSISRKLLNVNLEPPSMRSKSRLHPGNAGLGLHHMSAGDKLALAMIPEIDISRAASLMPLSARHNRLPRWRQTVEEGVDLAGAVAHHQHRVLAHIGREEVTRLRDLG